MTPGAWVADRSSRTRNPCPDKVATAGSSAGKMVSSRKPSVPVKKARSAERSREGSTTSAARMAGIRTSESLMVAADTTTISDGGVPGSRPWKGLQEAHSLVPSAPSPATLTGVH